MSSWFSAHTSIDTCDVATVTQLGCQRYEFVHHNYVVIQFSPQKLEVPVATE